MRKQICTMIAMVILLGCLAVSANAQCGGNGLIAKIPFQFSTWKSTLPAGDYQLTCSSTGKVLIRSRDGKAHAFMFMVPVSGKSEEGARLVFHRYGSRYFLVQAWAGGSDGLELPTTQAERSAARELAGIRPKRETIVLTARR